MTINYKSESKGFEAVDGNYTLTGNKVSREGTLIAVDGNAILKDGKNIGNFYVRYESGEPKLSTNNIPFGEGEDALQVIGALLAAFESEN